ncbi:hypothetical protein PN498_06910 [Oscillatoria sp. CS-180]|uniref:DUF6918 family protein n=1 Tax=Oscillatoria sp. CS-180 TaxID=3021720 RepID=UPI00233126B8|nr:hypothetical protein [Oscillatoria sp. CS-180]MDB9525712.1 hypothetical protein [Oscillatoria sp. CS-180]
MKLSDVIKDRSVKASIVEECTDLIDDQVSSKGGISGMALKTAYRVVKGVGPTYVPGAVGRVLPEAFKALDPMWNEGLQAGDPVGYLVEHRSRTADVILSVTDARVKKASGVVAGAYNKLRKSVKGDVEEAVPSLASIINKHVQIVQQA